VPEIVDDGVSGFIVEDVDGAVGAVGRLGDIDRRACRQAFDSRFDAGRMARDYLKVYEHVIEQAQQP
jgi:glycosyltransferase involved in cell wall biosynthesis